MSSAKVKTPTTSTMRNANPSDDLGEHAIGFQEFKTKIDYRKGPKKTSKDVEDVFEDCGADFSNID